MAPGLTETHTEAVITALTGTVTIGGSALPVVDVEAIDSVAPPYLVVQPSPGGRLDGPLGAPDDDLDFVVLVKTVTERHPTDGQGRAQCQHAADQARAVILGGVTVTDRRTQHPRLDVPGGVMVDRGVQPLRFYAVDRFVIPTSPA